MAENEPGSARYRCAPATLVSPKGFLPASFTTPVALAVATSTTSICEKASGCGYGTSTSRFSRVTKISSPRDVFTHDAELALGLPSTS